MNGPEHYRKAEECAAKADHILFQKGGSTQGEREVAAALAQLAQVHAQLAQVAATMNTASSPDYPIAEPPSAYDGAELTWRDVLS